MAIDAEAKRHLDIRLAKGEISKEEYASLRNLIAGTTETPNECFHVEATPPVVAESPEVAGERFGSETAQTATKSSQVPSEPLLARAAHSIESLRNLVSESRKSISPTNSHPYKVTEAMLLHGDHIEYHAVRHPYSTVTSTSYRAYHYMLNFVYNHWETRVLISCGGSDRVQASAFSMLIKSKTHNRILNAYSFINWVTFAQRIEPYFMSLTKLGYCEYDTVRMYANGDVIKDGVKVNLKVARKNNGLKFSSESNDELNYEVVKINETGKLLSPKKLSFCLGYNQDVAKSMLIWLSKQA